MLEEINITLTGQEAVQSGLTNINRKMGEFGKQTKSILSGVGKLRQVASFGAAVAGVTLGQAAQNVSGGNAALSILGRTTQGAGIGGIGGVKGAVIGAALGTAYGVAEQTGILHKVSDWWDNTSDETRIKEKMLELDRQALYDMQLEVFSAVRR